MQLKHMLLAFPLSWSIMIYILNFGLDSGLGLGANALVSFIISGITVITLSSLKIIDSGLSDGTARLLFILIFGGLFYGVTVASLYIGNTSIQSFSNGVLIFQNMASVDIDLNNIPSYIQRVIISPDSINPIIVNNPNYNVDAEVPEGTSIGGFASGANTGYGNSMFTDMPYFNIVNILFGLLYTFGLYFMVSD